MAFKDWLPASGFSLFVHVALLSLLAFSLSGTRPTPPPAPTSTSEPITAVAIDQGKVDAEIARLRDQEQSRRDEAHRLEKQRQNEQQRLADLKRQAKLEEQQHRQQAAAEQERLARLKAEQAALQAKQNELKRQQEQEKQRLAEIAQQRKIEAEKQRQEALQRQQAEEARQRAAAEKALKDQLAAEAKRLETEAQAQRSRQLSVARVEYASLIGNKVRQNWLRPAGSAERFSCKVLVTQTPVGDVTGVHIQASCGSPDLDRSVEAAVRKSSPLPKPPDPAVFDREIVFTFEPK